MPILFRPVKQIAARQRTGAWQRPERIAAEVTNGKTYVSDIAGSTHYHANYIRPRWQEDLKRWT